MAQDAVGYQQTTGFSDDPTLTDGNPATGFEQTAGAPTPPGYLEVTVKIDLGPSPPSATGIKTDVKYKHVFQSWLVENSSDDITYTTVSLNTISNPVHAGAYSLETVDFVFSAGAQVARYWRISMRAGDFIPGNLNQFGVMEICAHDVQSNCLGEFSGSLVMFGDRVFESSSRNLVSVAAAIDGNTALLEFQIAVSAFAFSDIAPLSGERFGVVYVFADSPAAEASAASILVLTSPSSRESAAESETLDALTTLTVPVDFGHVVEELRPMLSFLDDISGESDVPLLPNTYALQDATAVSESLHLLFDMAANLLDLGNAADLRSMSSVVGKGIEVESETDGSVITTVKGFSDFAKSETGFGPNKIHVFTDFAVASEVLSQTNLFGLSDAATAAQEAFGMAYLLIDAGSAVSESARAIPAVLVLSDGAAVADGSSGTPFSLIISDAALAADKPEFAPHVWVLNEFSGVSEGQAGDGLSSLEEAVMAQDGGYIPPVYVFQEVAVTSEAQSLGTALFVFRETASELEGRTALSQVYVFSETTNETDALQAIGAVLSSPENVRADETHTATGTAIENALSVTEDEAELVAALFGAFEEWRSSEGFGTPSVFVLDDVEPHALDAVRFVVEVVFEDDAIEASVFAFTKISGAEGGIVVVIKDIQDDYVRKL